MSNNNQSVPVATKETLVNNNGSVDSTDTYYKVSLPEYAKPIYIHEKHISKILKELTILSKK